MENKEQRQIIKHYAEKTEHTLKEYVGIHNNFFNKTGTFISLFKNWFKKIDYEKCYQDTSKVFHDISLTCDDTKSFKEKTYDHLDENQKKFINCLIEYQVALFKTLKIFLKITYESWQASKSFKQNNLTFKDFNANMKEYEKLIDEYSAIGSKLMVLYEKTRDEK